MTVRSNRLWSLRQTAVASDDLVYTCPAATRTIVKMITVGSLGACTMTVWLSIDAGATLQRIAIAVHGATGQVDQLETFIVLRAGDRIYVRTSSNQQCDNTGHGAELAL